MPSASSIAITCLDALAIFSEHETLRLQTENTRLEAELTASMKQLHAVQSKTTTPARIDSANMRAFIAAQPRAPATWQEFLRVF